MGKQTIWMVTGALGIVAIGAGAAIADSGDGRDDLGPDVELDGGTVDPAARDALRVEVSSTVSPITIARIPARTELRLRRLPPALARGSPDMASVRHPLTHQRMRLLSSSAAPSCRVSTGPLWRRYYGTRSGRLA
ncbi:hypothetical protein Dac01nite_14110 [Demequina activiva]|uniref:Uncharacterized protein n=1 Tax=Demequina activiva TaxID=1582364 RepID=A0A919Q2Z7_9MICO|nr:hypothetical protein Dac01nite_14110 [Demequina activiva]